MTRALLLGFAFILFTLPTLEGAACITADSKCTEWITLGGGPSRSLVYRTYSLSERNLAITRALVMVHGASRDADNYFRSALAAAFLAGALDNTIIVAPRMASNDGGGCKDALDTNEISWTCGGPDRWTSGGPAMRNDKVTSFDFMDTIVRKLANKGAFPNLKAIVLAGHSAGGQFFNRYEMANLVHDEVGIPMTYVVSNPSSYAYLEAIRPTNAAYPVTSAAPGYMPAPPAQAFAAFSDATSCTAYDKWPYGMKERTGYTSKLSEDQLKKQLTSRPTTYLLGELDILPLGGFDSSCAAMAQGPTRLARGLAFTKYVNEKLGGSHKSLIVPLCGHNARCMFTAEPVLPLLFPKQQN